MTAAILASHRRIPPYGMAGGSPGALGANWVERTDGTRTELTYADETEMNTGDIFVIETPGGGGFGRLSSPVVELRTCTCLFGGVRGVSKSLPKIPFCRDLHCV